MENEEVVVNPSSQRNSKFPLIIGIAGGSGSGKTTLAAALVRELGASMAVIITHDSYYKDISHLSLEERASTNFDHPSALDTPLLVHHLNLLRSNAETSIEVPIYDYTTHSRVKNETIRVELKPVIIVEGILIFAEEELLDLMDIKVFVDTEDDVRLARRIERDTVERHRTVQSVLQQYFKTVRPMHMQFVAATKHKADIVIPAGLNAVALDLLVHRLRAVNLSPPLLNSATVLSGDVQNQTNSSSSSSDFIESVVVDALQLPTDLP